MSLSIIILFLQVTNDPNLFSLRINFLLWLNLLDIQFTLFRSEMTFYHYCITNHTCTPCMY